MTRLRAVPAIVVAALRRGCAWLARAVRCGKALATDRRLPRWLRILFVIGCIQVPVLPFDEVALILAVGILALRHRPLLREAWAGAAR